jgi:hypothetical protein
MENTATAKAQHLLDTIAAGRAIFSRAPQGWTVVGPAAIITTGATITVAKADGSASKVVIGAVGPVREVQGIAYRVAEFRNAPAARPAARSRYSTPRRDHEDCLSLGSCGPRCDYAFAS